MPDPLTTALILVAAVARDPTPAVPISIFDIVPDSVIAATITGIVGLTGAWIAHRVTARKNASDAMSAEFATIRSELADVRDRQSKTEALADEMRTQRDEAVRRADDAEDTLRDRDELLADFAAWTTALHAWGEAGAPPPPPATTWRIDEWQREQAAHTGQLRRQQARGDH